MEKEIAAQKEQQMILDKEAFTYFCNNAGEKAPEIKQLYTDFQLAEKQHNTYIEVGAEIMRTVNPFFNGNLMADQVAAEVAALKESQEPRLKQLFQSFVDEAIITKELHDTLYERIIDFNSASYAYFINNEFQSHELNELCDLLVQVNEALNNRRFDQYKEMLEKQLNGQCLNH